MDTRTSHTKRPPTRYSHKISASGHGLVSEQSPSLTVDNTSVFTKSEEFLNQVFLGDCVDGMRRLPSDSMDLIITDPPFAIDFRPKRSNYNRTASRVLDGYAEIAKIDYPLFTRRWMTEAFRLLKPSGSMFVFSGWNNLKDILVSLEESGFITVNHIIWKYQFGVVTTRKFVTSHYHCLYVCKDDAQRKFFPYARFPKDSRHGNGGSLHYQDKEDVWVIHREYWHGDQKTPTKLPAELITKILAYTSEPGDTVLDPFLGSGQVAVVSKQMKRHYVGFEIVKEYHQFSKKRLEKNMYRISASEPSGQIELDSLLVA